MNSDARFDQLLSEVSSVSSKLTSFESKLNSFEKRIGKKLDSFGERLVDLEDRMRYQHGNRLPFLQDHSFKRASGHAFHESKSDWRAVTPLEQD